MSICFVKYLYNQVYSYALKSKVIIAPVMFINCSNYVVRQPRALPESFSHTLLLCKLYDRRKKAIERIFAYAKEKHLIRTTYFRELTRIINCVKFKFAAMHLKSMYRTGGYTVCSCIIYLVFSSLVILRHDIKNSPFIDK